MLLIKNFLDLAKNCSLTNVQQQSTRRDRALDMYLITTNPSLVKSVAVVPGMSDYEVMVVIATDIRHTYSIKT